MCLSAGPRRRLGGAYMLVQPVPWGTRGRRRPEVKAPGPGCKSQKPLVESSILKDKYSKVKNCAADEETFWV